MKIAQLIDSLKIGGAQKLQVSFAQAAAIRNLPLTIISLQESTDSPIFKELQNMKARVVSFSAKRLFDRERLFKLIHFLRAERFDLLQTHLNSANILGSLAGRLVGIPVIATLHSSKLDPRHYRAFRTRAETFVLRHACTRVVAVGHVVADQHRDRVGHNHLQIIPNAVIPATEIHPHDRIALRRSLFPDPEVILILSVGRLSPPKAYEDLIDAFAIVSPRYPQARLAIAGGGPLQQKLQEQIQNARMQSQIRLLGERDDIPHLLGVADLYVSSSHWEGLPISVLEAMSAGLPVIATSVGDLPHVVTPGAGLLVPPSQPQKLADAITNLLVDRGRAAGFGRNAREHVRKHYSLLPWMDTYISLYEEILNGRSELASAG